MNRALEKLKEELVAVVPPTLFFFLALHVVGVIRTLMARGSGYDASSTVAIGVAALILGKAVLIADHLPAINRFPDHPLIYNVGWKSLIYLLVATAIHFAERVVDFALESGSLVVGWEETVAHIVWPHFWAIEILLSLLILLYSTARELIRLIGRERVLRIFFGPTPLPKI